MSTDKYLCGIHAVVLESGMGKGRAGILCRQLQAKGGTVDPSVSDSTTHLLVGNNVRRSRLPVLLGGTEVPSRVRVVRADWLSSCLARGKRLREDEYEVPQSSLDPSPTSSPQKAAVLNSTSPSSAGRGGHSGRQEERGRDSSLVGCVGKESEGKEVAAVEDQHCVAEREEVTGVEDQHCVAEGEEVTGVEDQHCVAEREEVTGVEDQHCVAEGEEVAGVNHHCVAERYPTSLRRWHTSKKRASPDSDSDYVDSGEEEEGQKLASVDTSTIPPLTKRKRRWICEIPKSDVQSWVNHNKHITDKLEELLSVYQSSAEDKWRAMSTTKVIQAIKKHPREITSYEEALSLPFVGKRLAQKIEEIISSGDLRRLEAVDKEKQAVLSTFTKIHGVGQTVAEQFYAQGYRSVEELAASGVLNRQQTIGVKHFQDFQERMLREEVTEIEEKVRELAHQINSGLEVITCGSYRRGKPTCGDVDILVTHSDGRSHRGVLSQLVEEGKKTGFLTDDLSIHNDQNGGGKYLGVCRLPGEKRKYRRIDIYVTPYSEFPCMLLHFTGSGHFNRSMRSKADKLNGVKVFNGTPVPVFSEKDIFKYLDIEYREPKERDWD